MILLREVQEKDLDAILQLAQIPGFFNLPEDRDQLLFKIKNSHRSFKGDIPTKDESKYMFVAEDLETKQIFGTSMIAGQHGTEEEPHFFFQVDTEEKYSDSIKTGFIHGTLELKYDTDGPSELGGLVVHQDFRNHDEHIGRQISFVRFLFLSAHRELFKDQIIAELLPPLNKKGKSPLWEAVGRRFTNMDYIEADELSRKDKGFIFSLFPSGKIYTTFLPAEARNAIGKVSKITEPAFHLLRKIGFTYPDQIDPFDGGPHLWAKVEDLSPVKNFGTFTYDSSVDPTLIAPVKGILAKSKQEKGQFRAIACSVIRRDKKIKISDSEMERTITQLLKIEPGESVWFTPFY